MSQTLDQRRAKHAWAAIISLKENGKYSENAKEYAREAKKMPIRIMASGLGQALSFVLSKSQKRKSLEKLNKDLTEWVIKVRPLKALKPDNLMASLIEGDSDFLRRATDETLAYLQWLNRFAEAEGLADDEG